MSNVEALIRLPHIRVLSEEEGYWEIYREIAGDVPALGNMVPDERTWQLLCDSME